jgi:hypothetical protein
MDDADELSRLRAHLDSQRQHVLGSLDDLTADQLRRPVLPSGWTCLEMLRHLTVADERYWFECVMGGAPLDALPTGPRADWLVGEDEDPGDLIEGYQAAIEHSDEVIAGARLHDPPRQPDPDWAEWGIAFPDLGSILLHVIAETAVHAGHLDAVRELIDGRQWIVLE